jgi:hypothetical protein
LINKDVEQSFVDPQDNYEIVLEGDWRSVSTDPEHVITPFLNGGVQLSYDGTNTTVSFSGDAIGQGTFPEHFGFGYGISKDHSKIKREYWTRQTEQNDTPGCSTGYDYDAATETVTATFANDTDSTVTLADSFFEVFATPLGLADLNRTNLPPGSGNPTGVTPVTLDPGESVSFVINGVQPSDAVVTFVAVEFTSPPPGGYDQDVGIWTQVTRADFPSVPAVSEWGLVVMAGLLVVAGAILVRRHQRMTALGRPA